MTCLWTSPCWWRARYTLPFITRICLSNIFSILSYCHCFLTFPSLSCISFFFSAFLCLLSVASFPLFLFVQTRSVGLVSWLLSHMQLVGVTSPSAPSFACECSLTPLCLYLFISLTACFPLIRFALFGHKLHTPITPSRFVQKKLKSIAVFQNPVSCLSRQRFKHHRNTEGEQSAAKLYL